MNAIIKQVSIEDRFGSNLEWAIVLDVGEENFGPMWKCLEDAGFILRNWEDNKIIVYSPKTKRKDNY